MAGGSEEAEGAGCGAGRGLQHAPWPAQACCSFAATLCSPAPPAAGSAPLPRQGIAFALSLQPDGACYCCKGSRWWLSAYGVLACCRCHPPPMPELVARYMDGKEAVLLAHDGQR